MRRFLAPVWHPSAALLGVQLLGVLLYPYMDQSQVGRAAFSIFGLVVLVLAVRAVQVTPALTWISIALGMPILVLSVVSIIDPTNSQAILAAALLFTVFYAYTSYALLRYMFQERIVSADTLYATGATFTVVAWAFAYTYVAVQIIWPGSFAGSAPAGTPLGWFELLFLSFTTLSSVGLSDIVPVVAQARSVVMIEQVGGLLYVALIVSRVVGLTVAAQRVRHDPTPSTPPRVTD